MEKGWSDMGSIQFRNCLFKKNGNEINNLELEFATKIFNPHINLPFNSEICLPRQSCLEYKLLGVSIQSMYSEYLLQSVIGVDKNWNCN